MTGNLTRPAIDKPSLGVFACARCGQDHPATTLDWRRLFRPIGPSNFWAPCPVNGDPILLVDDPVLQAGPS